MNDQPVPHEDVDDVLQLDPALRQRIRSAIRDIPPQDADQAQASLDAALQALQGRQRRRGAWLAVAAAGVVGVLGVAVLRGPQSSEPDSEVEMVASPMVADEPSALRMAESTGPSAMDLDQFRLVISEGSPLDQVLCPVVGAQRSYGVRPWEGRDVEIVVDVTGDVFLVLDVATCEVLVIAPLTP